ncbi:MAG: DUF6575 domain-containing protein [Anaerolineae bacterium]|jgi:hypothetical protein|uniref:DUF6575 domain-containing protein n=1 Tax=Candidatus Amarolinea dominans TaxID=3140696 RepID=UPI001D494855|nr:hypothetical protein [Anaerolineae bacterium]MBK9095486.1 hypothetical protein [Anaerolineae bacterium]
MITSIPTIDLDQIELLETYEFYDRPLLFACRNKQGILFIAVLADENDTNETWLYVPLTDRRLSQIRAGLLDLHDAFEIAEDGEVLIVSVFHGDGRPISVDIIAANSIPQAWLPARGERLNLNPLQPPALNGLTGWPLRKATTDRSHTTSFSAV